MTDCHQFSPPTASPTRPPRAGARYCARARAN
nr:MAG TPA: hypothetical protein [Caudoviricetes sp.]